MTIKLRPIYQNTKSFDEAQTVFDDPLYVDFYDPDHSDDEHRFITIGQMICVKNTTSKTSE